ncbi:MAG: bifunctional [glutamate--ammonia ligase]-adenylyl-L-tyrosine phosphorylase/[glutamate--ammonia-ligase] adenylyltransferase [Verrucomicrobiota bacterium]
MSSRNRWIEEKSAATICPEQVARTLQNLQENWPEKAAISLRDFIEWFPLGEAALLHLLSVSSICADRFAQHPEILFWLQQADVCGAQRGHGRMLADLDELAGDAVAADNFRLLRLWKGREMSRIALREVAELAPLEETTAELSQLAEICVAQVFEHWNSEMRSRSGAPETEFAVLGLGKLGGRELNHSSDIDVIFLYGDEGHVAANLSYHEWFNRLGMKIAETFSSAHPAGSLFRIDLRLRPEGKAGPLVRSLESMENYYSGFGETWERLALIKARGICGSREIAYEFLRQHQPFIYPKSPTPDLLDEIAAIKRRIERDIVGHENLERNVKLGQGGIREIEFVVQALQLIHGARNTFLQEQSTLKVLAALAQLDLLPRKEAMALDSAYRFLRRVEHRLQIEAEQQIHTVPNDPEELRRLALSLGYPTRDEFLENLREQMRNVRAVFLRVISQPSSAAERTIQEMAIFRDEARATKSMTDLVQGKGAFHVAPRTRQIFRKLRPFLIAWLRHTADPDATLNQFVRFVEAYGLRSLLFEILTANPRLLELIIKTLDASRHAADLLIRRPQLLEDITRGARLDDVPNVNDHLRQLNALPSATQNFDGVRAYRQMQWMRIVVRDVLELAASDSIFAEQSTLAEACLIFVEQLLDQEDKLTVIGMGKFGGGEITYGADLDVLFVGENTKAAQQILVAMGQPSAEGSISPLDARLRPDGDKGPLVCSLGTYESYYANRAQLWELQALTRARGICGPLKAEFEEMAQRLWRDAGQRENLFTEINGMLERIRRERGGGSDFLEFKTGTGGIIEAEFIVQALQMRAGIWNPNWRDAIAGLVRAGEMSDSEAANLKTAYDFLRRCESVLRRREDKSVSILPGEELEQCKVARWLGSETVESFRKEYAAARETIHSIYLAKISAR